MVFETDRLYVRHWQQADLRQLHVEYIRPLLTIDETKRIFDDQLLQYQEGDNLGRFVIMDKKSHSYTGIFMLRKPAGLEGIEIGYSFRKQDWGKGYATEIVKKGVDYIFSFTEYDIIYAITHLQNINSKKVLLKCGFKQRGNVIEDGKESALFAYAKNIKSNRQFSSHKESALSI